MNELHEIVLAFNATKPERVISSEPVNCGGCGRFVSLRDPRLTWESERDDYGSYLSRWVVGCVHCAGAKP